MKKLYIIVSCLVSSLNFGQTIYSENIGIPTANTPVSVYTGWQNTSPIAYTGSGSSRTSSPSSGYTGASGNGNVFLTGTAGTNLTISGINTVAYSSANIQLTFGYFTQNTGTQLLLEQSTNGITWTPINFTQNPNTSWNLVTIADGQIVSSGTLSLRFTQPATTQMRIDDIKLVNFSSTCTLSLGPPLINCVNSSLALDNYTVTIPYSGGGNASYSINTTGTISGDDPTTTATGNIIITFTEDNSYTINITGGTCNLDTNGNSPECKPVNTFPFNESFPYTIGNSLNGEQKWTIVNSGDNILVANGSLSYTGITATGNSVSFSGVGAESRTLFTNTTNGSVFASFIATASDLSNITTDLTNTYFALFTDNAGISTNARIWIRKNGTQYQYGIGTSASPSVWDITLYNANDIQYLVLGYDFAYNQLSLFINPTVGASNVVPNIMVNLSTPLSSVGGFILRQDDILITPTMIIDELTIDLTPNFTLDTNSFDAIESLTMYPNPLKGNTLYLTSNANAEMSVQIFDLLGKEVVKANVINNTINVANLQAGVYIAKITEEGKTATRKLVIQ
jgi:hypothetical protein